YSESHIKTLTLYSRTAKVFYIAIDMEKDTSKISDNYSKAIGQITCMLLNFKSFDEDCFKKFYDEFSAKKRIDVEKINDIESPEIMDDIATLDVRATKYIIDTLCWLSFISEKQDVQKEFNKCFKK
ncbi:MAG: hypothetical protein ACTSSH_11735, partial [Candidatus Heimdallarchaeota archaeon]